MVGYCTWFRYYYFTAPRFVYLAGQYSRCPHESQPAHYSAAAVGNTAVGVALPISAACDNEKVCLRRPL